MMIKGLKDQRKKEDKLGGETDVLTSWRVVLGMVSYSK